MIMIFVAIDSNDDQENINTQIDELMRTLPVSNPLWRRSTSHYTYTREVIVTFGRGHHDLHKGRGEAYVSHEGGEGEGAKRFSHVRALSLREGGTRFRKT